MKDLLTVALVATAIVTGPLLFIWCLNALFSISTPYTLETWFAAGLLAVVFAR